MSSGFVHQTFRGHKPLLPTMPAHGVGERALKKVVVLCQQTLHDLTQTWGVRDACHCNVHLAGFLPACCLLVLSSSERSGSLRTCRLGSRRVSYGHVALHGRTVVASTALKQPSPSPSPHPHPSAFPTFLTSLTSPSRPSPSSPPSPLSLPHLPHLTLTPQPFLRTKMVPLQASACSQPQSSPEQEGKERIVKRQEYKSGAILPSSPFPTGRSLPALVGHVPGSTDAGWCPAQTNHNREVKSQIMRDQRAETHRFNGLCWQECTRPDLE